MVLSESENLSGPSSDEPPVSSPTIPPVVSDQQPSTSHSSLPLTGRTTFTKTEITQILSGDFMKNFYIKAVEEMKKITGFDRKKNYTGAELDAMFTTLSLCIENYHSKCLENSLQINDQNFLTLSAFQSTSGSTFSPTEAGTVEKLPDNSVTLENGDSNDPNESTAIDVDAIELDVEDCSSADSNSSRSKDDDRTTTSNNNNEVVNTNLSKTKNKDNINIPDIEKELDLLKDKNNLEDSNSGDSDSETSKTSEIRLKKNSDEKDDSSKVNDKDNPGLFTNDGENSPETGPAEDEANNHDESVWSYNYCADVEELFETCVNEGENGNLNISSEEDNNGDIDDDDDSSDNSNNSINDDEMGEQISEDEIDDFAPKKTDKKLEELKKLVKDNNKLLNSSDDDSDVGVKKKNVNNLVTKVNSGESEEEDEENVTFRRKSKKHLFNSDDDDSGKDNEQTNESSSDSSDDFCGVKIKKRKRKRVVRMCDNESDTSRSSGSDTESLNKSRKKLKKILSPDRRTRDAEKNELERRKRIEEKQKLYNQLIVQENQAQSEQVNQVVLDFDKESKKILVEVNKEFVKHLKPHQVEGIKFLFNCTIESVERLTKHNHSSGCILAHTMGLGKTFQVISFLHTIMTNPLIKDSIRCVLIIVPLNVIQNWANEFEKWFDECGITKEIEVYKDFYNDKTSDARKATLKRWKQSGGILLCTNSLFNNCLKKSKNTKQSCISKIKEYLLNPGPDMVIIDEGHLLKNEQGVFNKNLSQIATLRRVILTGTPLQNNLGEYYTMVSFVKPNLLGDKREFKNRFENPIKNGQNCDSTEYDVKMMKKRVHILFKLLKECIHRCDYNVLVPYLQPKFEYVLSLRLTELQEKLYKYYLENLTGNGEMFQRLFADFTRLSYIWNHPALLPQHYKRKRSAEDQEDDDDDDDANSMDDFIVDGSSSESVAESDDSDTLIKKEENMSVSSKEEFPEIDSDIEIVFEKQVKKVAANGSITSEPAENEQDVEDESTWFEKFMPENLLDLNLSAKFILLFTILEKCEIIGDKILIFSQSLNTLNLIEDFLKIKMKEYVDKYGPMDDEESYENVVAQTGGVSHSWERNRDYFRIDGNVNSNLRTKIQEHFNDPGKHRARLLLISTKAGGIGINLVGANRCVIFDASWNPANDMQAIFRIFRYGQLKPVYVYRFTASGTMESKIYERQILKQSLSHRVIDEQQIQRHFKAKEANELYQYHGADKCRKVPKVPKDNLLADVYQANKDLILNCHEHDSLLENCPEEGLTEEERKLAWAEYENEKDKGLYPEPSPAFINNFPTAEFNAQMNQQYHDFQRQMFGQQFSQSANFPTTSFTPQAHHSRMPSLYEQQFAYRRQQHAQQQQQQQQQNYHLFPHQLPQNPPQNPHQQHHRFQHQLPNRQQYENQHRQQQQSLLQQKQLLLHQQNQQNTSRQSGSLSKASKSINFEMFMIDAEAENKVNIIYDWNCNLNLPKVVEYKDMPFDAFNQSFRQTIPFEYDGENSKYLQYMYCYLDKLITIANIYKGQLQNLSRKDSTVQPTLFTVVKSLESLKRLFQEFHTYRGKVEEKSKPHISNAFLQHRNFLHQQRLPQRSRSNVKQIEECITISDDDEPK